MLCGLMGSDSGGRAVLRGKRGMGTWERKTLAKGLEEDGSEGCGARGSSRWIILSSRTSLV